jgi:UPF0755 protein
MAQKKSHHNLSGHTRRDKPDMQDDAFSELSATFGRPAETSDHKSTAQNTQGQESGAQASSAAGSSMPAASAARKGAPDSGKGGVVPPEPPLSRTERRNRERRKSRRRTKKALRISLIILLVLAIVGGLGFGAVALINGIRNQHTAQQAIETEEAADWPGPGYGSVQFTIATGESGASVARRLAKKKIVASAQAFTDAVIDADAGQKIKPGTFTLKYRMAAKDVVTIVTDSTQAKGMIGVTADERVSEVITSVASLSKTITKDDLESVINGGGSGILPSEANGKFEGWLQPGTYDPSAYSSATALLTDMVKKRIAFLDALKVPTGSEREQILTIASIIGGEVNRQEYYGKVSRVIANRLAKNMPLGMDSVVAYGNNVAPSQLTQAMLEDTSNAYNSRVKTGLPPTPINQPDKSMIEAAMNPEKGDWLYFVTVNLNTGETKFTADEAQFQQYAKEYRDWAAKNQ